MLGLFWRRRRARAPAPAPAVPSGAELERLLVQEPATYTPEQVGSLHLAYRRALAGRAQWAAELDASQMDRAQRYLVYASAMTVTGFFLLWTVGAPLHGWGRTALVGVLAAVGAVVYVGLHGALHERLVRRIARIVAMAPMARSDPATIAVADAES